MIFEHTWKSILCGEKTETRRLLKVGQRIMGDALYQDGRETPYRQKGQRLKVQPGYGERAVWWRHLGTIQTIYDKDCPASVRTRTDTYLKHDGWQPLTIQITALRTELLQAMDDEAALREGVKRTPLGTFRAPHCDQEAFLPLAAYKALWNQINLPSKHWRHNPTVVVYQFKVLGLEHS